MPINMDSPQNPTGGHSVGCNAGSFLGCDAGVEYCRCANGPYVLTLRGATLFMLGVNILVKFKHQMGY